MFILFLLFGQVWVFGLRERLTARCYFEIVKNRDRLTFLVSDSWSAYNDISRLNEGYSHAMVNHKLHFVNPGTEIHTFGIESLWNSAKRLFKQMNGCARPQIQAYLNEFCWRKSFANTKELAFEKMFTFLA